MCGVVAIWSPRGAAAADVTPAIRALHHRGPDGDGAWRSPDGRIALGHARLAVIDRAGGAQPVRNEDGSVVAVINGEIYDHVRVGERLRARGHTLRGGGDAELLVHLYEDGALDTLRGEHAYVVWDARARRLLAVRDRFGIKPLVWTRLPGGAIAIASEAKALFALGASGRWDDEMFWHAAHTQYVWPDRTLFAEIRQVPPGAMLTIDDDGAITTREVAPIPTLAFATDARYRTLDDAAAALREVLDESVALRTVADVPLAVQLSGGVDSTAVAALAARHRRDLRAFTVGFADPAYDERPIARASAAALGLPLDEVVVDAAAIADGWCDAVAHGEGLAINGHVVAKWLLSRAMRAAGVRVALTGEGADELLGGYPHLRRDVLGEVDLASHAASRGVMLPDGDGLLLDSVRAVLGFVPTWLEAKATLGKRVRGLLAVPAFGDPYAALVEHTGVAARVRLHASAHAWMRSALAQYILRTLGDAMELAHGIEGRVPFLDARVAAVALAIDPAVVVDARVDKPVLRHAMRGIVPEAVLARPKHPFLAPPLSRIAPALVQDVLRGYAARSPLLDRAAVVAVLDALPTMPAREQQAWDPALMLVLSAAILQERYA